MEQMENTQVKNNLIMNTAGMIIYNLAVWFFGFLIIRMLGETASGHYAIVSSVGNTIYAISLWGMRTYIVSDTEDRYKPGEYVGARVLEIVISLAVLGVYILFSSHEAVTVKALCAYTVFKAAEAMIEVLDCLCQRKMVMAVNAGSMIIRGIAYIVFFLLVLKLKGSMAAGFWVLTVISVLMFFFYNLPRVRKIVQEERLFVFDSNLKQIISACMPIMVFELLSSLIVAIPRLVYGRYGDLADLGIYNTIYTMVVFLQLAINILIFTLSPYMAKAFHDGDRKAYHRYMFLLFGGALGLGAAAEILVFLIGRPVMSLVYGQAAGMHYDYLYTGIICGVTLTFTWIAVQIFVIRGFRYAHLLCAVISTAVCFVLSALMISGSSCEMISYVLILANLSFLLAAGAVFIFAGKKASI